jgi:glycerol-3-phosphate cytidylyltransferase
MPIVYTGGTFDVLHAGHIDLLRACKEIAGNYDVWVGLNSDEFIKRFKGKPPVCSFEERKDVLLGCKYVNRVIKNEGGEDSKPAILTARPNFIVIGDDWATRDYYRQMGFTPEWLIGQGIILVYVARLRELSSTEIKRRAHGQLGDKSLSEKQARSTKTYDNFSRPSKR